MSGLSERAAALSPAKRALLERRLQELRSTAAPQRIARRERLDVPVPLSFAQQRLWVLDQLEPGHWFYNLPASIRLRGPLHVSKLEQTLTDITRRHETLRTTFERVDGQPVQVPRDHTSFDLSILDLGSVARTQREAEATRHIEAEARRPFDLVHEPPFRATLLRLSPTEHILLVTMHHIASDGWSMGILQRELTELYRAHCHGARPDLPDLPIQYADFAVWQRQHLQGPVLDELLGYWTEQLAEMPALLELPLDGPRPPVQVFDGATYATSLPLEMLDGLKALCRRAGATLFAALLSGFEVLLSRYSGRTDLVVGTPVANRGRVELEGLIGFFVNTLVLRTDLGGDPSFLEVVRRTQRVSLDALSHQDLPFEKLVEEIRPARDLSHNPLFQVMFALQNVDAPRALEPAQPRFRSGTSKFDLTLSATETTTGVQALFEYNSTLFDAATVVGMAQSFEAILEKAIADPDRRLSELLRATPAAHGRRAGDAVGKVPAAATVHALCERQAQLRPDAPALLDSRGQSVSYRELNERASLVAADLQAFGVGLETRVGLCAERSPEFVIGAIGAMKAGAAFVPLDPTYPPSRLADMVKDSGIAILLTQDRLISVLPSQSVPVVRLDADWDRIANRPALCPPVAVVPDNLAYVIYTSGSTGRPKGVMVPHGGVCNVAEAQMRIFAIDSEDRILQFSALSFDAAVFELVMALRAGATLCLAPSDALLPGAPLLRTLSEMRINVLTISPSALAALPDASLPDLRTVIAAAEPCSAELVARWSPGRRFFNAYGPTEATIWATLAECTDPGRTPPIGRAVQGVATYVLDEHLVPVPTGVPGELFIGGLGVARGYEARPGATAETYLPDPFAGADGRRMYRTGDRVRELAGGELQFLGRLDDQIKIRGYRVEPGEIQATLLGHPAVREAAVVARRDQGGALSLLAFYVPASRVAPAQLRAYLSERLPQFMLPSQLAAIDAIPLTDNGKLDRRALLAFAEDASRSRQREGREPHTESELAVAGIWCELLGIELTGVEDDFFALGGHSLLATEVVERVNETFGIDLPMRAVFETPVLATLAEAVDARRAEVTVHRDTVGATEPAIVPLARKVVAVPDHISPQERSMP